MKFNEFVQLKKITIATHLNEWLPSMIGEGVNTASTRYSVDVNFRTTIKEATEAFAKICLGYVSAALKQSGYHVKHVFEQKPIRILASSRNWDDGEWVGMIYFHPEHEGGTFVLAKGFYNKETRSVSMQSRKKCDGDSAADLARELRNIMHDLKGKPDRHMEKLKSAPLKRGPKK